MAGAAYNELPSFYPGLAVSAVHCPGGVGSSRSLAGSTPADKQGNCSCKLKLDMERLNQEDCCQFEASVDCTVTLRSVSFRERLASKNTDGSQAWWPAPIGTALRRQSQEEHYNLGESLIKPDQAGEPVISVATGAGGLEVQSQPWQLSVTLS